jgi:hypothetical protein
VNVLILFFVCGWGMDESKKKVLGTKVTGLEDLREVLSLGQNIWGYAVTRTEQGGAD